MKIFAYIDIPNELKKKFEIFLGKLDCIIDFSWRGYKIEYKTKEYSSVIDFLKTYNIGDINNLGELLSIDSFETIFDEEDRKKADFYICPLSGGRTKVKNFEKAFSFDFNTYTTQLTNLSVAKLPMKDLIFTDASAMLISHKIRNILEQMNIVGHDYKDIFFDNKLTKKIDTHVQIIPKNILPSYAQDTVEYFEIPQRDKIPRRYTLGKLVYSMKYMPFFQDFNFTHEDFGFPRNRRIIVSKRIYELLKSFEKYDYYEPICFI